MALNNGVKDKLLKIREKYDNLSSKIAIETDVKQIESFQSQRTVLKTYVDCLTALETIEKDLEMFSEHLTGTDAKLKKVAEIYTTEFTTCQSQIETQLNKLMADYIETD
eukprot:gene7706-15773_t